MGRGKIHSLSIPNQNVLSAIWLPPNAILLFFQRYCASSEHCPIRNLSDDAGAFCMSTRPFSVWARLRRLPFDSLAAVAATLFIALVLAGVFSRVPW